MKKMILFVLLISTYTSYSQTLKVGDKAPKLFINKWIKPDNPKNLQNKPLLIDFWGTWCAPCIASFPHINQLSETYKNKINFLSITTDDEKILSKFLSRIELNTFIATDKDGQTTKGFKIESIPAAYLIDTQGVIQWLGNPKDLTTNLIDTFLATGKNTSLNKNQTAIPLYADSNPLIIQTFTIEEKMYDSINHMMIMTPKERLAFILVKGEKLSTVLKNLLEIQEPYIDFKSNNIKNNICLNIELKSKVQTTEKAATLLLNQLLDIYNLQIDTTEKKINGWEVTIIDSSKLSTKETVLTNNNSMIAGFISNNVYVSTGGTITNFLTSLEEKFSTPITLKNTSIGYYDFEIQGASFNELKTNAEHTLGLKFNHTNKNIKVYIIKDKF